MRVCAVVDVQPLGAVPLTYVVKNRFGTPGRELNDVDNETLVVLVPYLMYRMLPSFAGSEHRTLMPQRFGIGGK